jgi:chromosome partitioning protein
MAVIIAIHNQKGGVAKTTTCLSLGAALAEMGRSVLLIDMDPQAHLTLSLGLQPDKMHRTIKDALLQKASLVSVSRESEIFGLDIIPADSSLSLIDKLLYGQKRYEFNLKERLAGLDANLYDFVLMDCPPYLGTLTLNALTAAQHLIIPSQSEYYASHSLRQITGLVKLVQKKTNPTLTFRVLITMYDRRNKISRIIREQMQNDLQNLLYETVIEVDTKLKESPVFGKPVTLYAPKTRGAEQYRELAKELLNHD